MGFYYSVIESTSFSATFSRERTVGGRGREHTAQILLSSEDATSAYVLTSSHGSCCLLWKSTCPPGVVRSGRSEWCLLSAT